MLVIPFNSLFKKSPLVPLASSEEKEETLAPPPAPSVTGQAYAELFSSSKPLDISPRSKSSYPQPRLFPQHLNNGWQGSQSQASDQGQSPQTDSLRLSESISDDTASLDEYRLRMSLSTLKRKVVVLGSPSVGKTSLTTQWVAPPSYNDQYFPTIESTSHKTVSFQGAEYDCEVIDTAGQDEYTLFQAKHAVGVHGYLLVYSINSRQSFEMIQTVHDKILDFAGLQKVPCVVVGQKCDLSGDRRVTTAEGEALAKKIGAAFVESSAKDNKNVSRVFEVLLAEMRKEYNPAPEKKKGWFSWSS